MLKVSIPILATIVITIVVVYYFTYKIKYVLRKNNYETNNFIFHIADYYNMLRLIKSEGDIKLKRDYKILFFSLIFSELTALLILIYLKFYK
jgi:hypothetical protein